MRNPLTAAYDWLLLNYIRVLIAAELGPLPDDEERARLDFIADGGDPDFIERVERAYGIE